MPDLGVFAALAQQDSFCVIATGRADGSVQASLVNAGVMPSPLGGGDVVAFVAIGGSRKLANLRTRPRATAVVRNGPRWAAVEGNATLVGPDDRVAGIDDEQLRV